MKNYHQFIVSFDGAVLIHVSGILLYLIINNYSFFHFNFGVACNGKVERVLSYIMYTW